METERVEGRFRDWRDPEERRADTILTKISELVFCFYVHQGFAINHLLKALPACSHLMSAD